MIINRITHYLWISRDGGFEPGIFTIGYTTKEIFNYINDN